MTMTISKPSIWHPFTQMKTSPPPLRVKRGEGVFLELEDGRQIIDCISSWWTNLHGHANPIIAKAIYEQAQKLEHVMFAGFTHQPAEQLATALLKQLPNSLRHVFYSDNGSTAVETALKIACQYWYNQGKTRTSFLAFENSYHGDTIGAMSVGHSSPFAEPFRPMLFDVDLVPFPTVTEKDSDGTDNENRSLEALRQLVEINPDKYAAIIIEPLVEAVGGMLMCRPAFLDKLQAFAKEAGLLLIYDEVAIGFGRTGSWFACVKSNTSPDIICLAKAMTGGFLSLATTIVSDDVFQAFYSDDIRKTFFHGHTYTANPLACAAALASMQILEQNCQAFMNMEKIHRQKAAKYIAEHPLIHNLRFCGTIMAFDIGTADGTDYFDQIAPVLKQRFLDRNLLIRPFGNMVYVMPPYCITEDQLDHIYKNIGEVLDSLPLANQTSPKKGEDK